jgi:hypothetical protein
VSHAHRNLEAHLVQGHEWAQCLSESSHFFVHHPAQKETLALQIHNENDKPRKLKQK